MNFRSIGLLAAAWMIFPPLAWGHPFHISFAEMEFNPETGRVEVSLKLHPVDMEEALRRLSGGQVDLEQDRSDRLIEGYLNGHFYLLPHNQAVLLQQGNAIDPKTPRSKVSLVGKELETAWMWLYFEMELPGSFDVPGKSAGVEQEDYALVNTVLLDVADGQVNTVTIRHDAERDALRMTIKKPWGKIPGNWLEKRSAAGAN